MICKTSKQIFYVLFWLLAALVAACVACCAYYIASANATWRYTAAALAAAAILFGHHASFAARCHEAKVHAAISDTLTLVALVVLIVLLVRHPPPEAKINNN